MKFAVFMMTLLTPLILFAQTLENLDQAKSLADNNHKPILIEFYRPDCQYCQILSHDAATVDSLQALLDQVIHFPVDVSSEAGSRLVEPYYVGDTFPLFVLTDSHGEVLNRWLGYVNAASFSLNFKSAMANSVTVNDRERRFDANPTIDDALFLARYFDDIDENLKAVDFFRQAQVLAANSKINYSYDIFRNFADAVWNGKTPFDSLRVAADSSLARSSNDMGVISSVARIISNVARKTGNTNGIAKYLKAGIDITAGFDDPKTKEARSLYTADLALYSEKDTTAAISERKSLLPVGWTTNPQERYNFALWCLDRKINLTEADTLAYETALHVSDPEAQAKVFYLVAKIRDACNQINNAVAAMEKASELQPNNTRYSLELERLFAKAAVQNKSKN